MVSINHWHSTSREAPRRSRDSHECIGAPLSGFQSRSRPPGSPARCNCPAAAPRPEKEWTPRVPISPCPLRHGHRCHLRRRGTSREVEPQHLANGPQGKFLRLRENPLRLAKRSRRVFGESPQRGDWPRRDRSGPPRRSWRHSLDSSGYGCAWVAPRWKWV